MTKKGQDGGAKEAISWCIKYYWYSDFWKFTSEKKILVGFIVTLEQTHITFLLKNYRFEVHTHTVAVVICPQAQKCGQKIRQMFFFSSSQVSIIWKKFGTYSLLKPRKENKLYTAHFKEQPQLKSLVTINNVYSLALDLLAMLNYPL